MFLDTAESWADTGRPAFTFEVARPTAEEQCRAWTAAPGSALLMSVVNQTLVGVMGHLTIWTLAPQVQLIDSLVLSPLAFAAIFFPLTVAGAGTRDAAMVALYGLLGVPRETALSASLQVLLAYGLLAALGGALSLVTPLQSASADAT